MNKKGLELSVPLGVSGAFLCDKERFSEIHRLSVELSLVTLRLHEVEAKLRKCNDPEWLISFENQCHRRKRDPIRELPARVQKLEAAKAAFRAKADEARQKLLQLEPTALETTHSLVGRYFPVPAPPTARRMRNPEVFARNQVIDAHLDQLNDAICEIVDLDLKQPGRPTTGIPHSWVEKYGVSSFREAYEKCPHLVDSMISKRRKQKQSP